MQTVLPTWWRTNQSPKEQWVMKYFTFIIPARWPCCFRARYLKKKKIISMILLKLPDKKEAEIWKKELEKSIDKTSSSGNQKQKMHNPKNHKHLQIFMIYDYPHKAINNYNYLIIKHIQRKYTKSIQSLYPSSWIISGQRRLIITNPSKHLTKSQEAILGNDWHKGSWPRSLCSSSGKRR